MGISYTFNCIKIVTFKTYDTMFGNFGKRTVCKWHLSIWYAYFNSVHRSELCFSYLSFNNTLLYIKPLFCMSQYLTLCTWCSTHVFYIPSQTHSWFNCPHH